MNSFLLINFIVNVGIQKMCMGDVTRNLTLTGLKKISSYGGKTSNCLNKKLNLEVLKPERYNLNRKTLAGQTSPDAHRGNGSKSSCFRDPDEAHMHTKRTPPL